MFSYTPGPIWRFLDLGPSYNAGSDLTDVIEGRKTGIDREWNTRKR